MHVTYIGDFRNPNKRILVRIKGKVKTKKIRMEIQLFPNEVTTQKIMSIIDFIKEI